MRGWRSWRLSAPSWAHVIGVAALGNRRSAACHSLGLRGARLVRPDICREPLLPFSHYLGFYGVLSILWSGILSIGAPGSPSEQTIHPPSVPR